MKPRISDQLVCRSNVNLAFLLLHITPLRSGQAEGHRGADQTLQHSVDALAAGERDAQEELAHVRSCVCVCVCVCVTYVCTSVVLEKERWFMSDVCSNIKYVELLKVNKNLKAKLAGVPRLLVLRVCEFIVVFGRSPNGSAGRSKNTTRGVYRMCSPIIHHVHRRAKPISNGCRRCFGKRKQRSNGSKTVSSS